MQSLDPKVIVVFFLKNFLSTIYIIPIWFIGVSLFEHVWTNNIGIISKDWVVLLLDGAGFIFLTLLILGCYYWAWLAFSNLMYELQPDGLHIHQGVIIRRNIIIPYENIANVELLVNPLVVRVFQLYTVHVGIGELLNTEGIFRKKQQYVIPGLSSEAARSLKTELLNYSHVIMTKRNFSNPIGGRYDNSEL